MSNLLATPLTPFGDVGGRADDAREPLFLDPLDCVRNSAPRDDSRGIRVVVPAVCTTAIFGKSPTPSPPELDDRVIGEMVVLLSLVDDISNLDRAAYG